MSRSAFLGALALACACLGATPVFARGAISYLSQTQEPATAIGEPQRLAGARNASRRTTATARGSAATPPTASAFNPLGLSAAHRTLPIGAQRLVVSRNRQVIVRTNLRGSAQYAGRSLDLSYGAAGALGMTGAGVAGVGISVFH
jgi:rare lipoprotein A (peptidoglycan hydrolase)